MYGDERIPDAGLPPVFPSGLNLGELDLAGGSGFWEEVERFTALATLDAVLDQAAGGKPVPRVWVILDEPENTAARTTAALSLARSMSLRDQKVLLLEADDTHPDLTRWAGLAEQDGWIDFVRYGASLSSCCVALPWAKGRADFMGIGSFWPTEVEPAEVEKLVSRLRRQIDDLIITAPLDAAGLVWARQATMCVLCWDRLLRPTTEMQAMVHRLQDEGIPVAGIVGFGLDEAEILDTALQAAGEQHQDDAAVPAAFSGTSDRSPTREPAGSEAGGDENDTRIGAADSRTRQRASAEQGRHPATAQDGSRRSGDALEPSGDIAVGIPRRSRSGQRTSPIFWGAAGLLVVICAVIVILWVRMQDLPPQEQQPALAQQTTVADIDRSPPATPAATSVDSVAQAAMSSPAVLTGPRTDSLASDDSVAAPVEPSPPPGTGQRENMDLVASERATTVADPGAGAVTDQKPAQQREPLAPAQQESTVATPYAVPVGQAGWAIHLYSLPDEASTREEVATLERKGFRAAWRIEDVPGKGQYYRVYVGSFPSRAAAKAALPELKERLRLKWAQVRKF